MSPVAKLLGAIGSILLLITLAGLIVRGYWRLWYAFTAYLVLTVSFATAAILWPGIFFVWGSYTLQENAVNAVRFAFALELAGRTFYAFPGARSTLRVVLLGVLLFTLSAVVPFGWDHVDYKVFLEEMQPRIMQGTALLFAAIAGLILWYRLPVADFHKSILLSYVPYLLFQLVYLHGFVARSWENDAIGYVNQASYLALVSYWARVAWRKPPDRRDDSGSGPDTLSRVA